jgi:hypothetical protein
MPSSRPPCHLQGVIKNLYNGQSLATLIEVIIIDLFCFKNILCKI